MKHILYAAVASLGLLAPSARADMVDEILAQQILPGMQALADSSARFAQAADTICRPGASPLQRAYHEAFDNWIRVSHLRFGPTETDNRAFALAFWPDSRGKIPKTLAKHLREANPDLLVPETFAQSSIAGRGFYALEYMYFDHDFTSAKPHEFRCALTAAIARDIAENAAAIYADWRESYADQMRNAEGRYQNETEVKQELYKALNTGLQMLADMRLGRPLGTFDKPRPKRAEAWRSGRSQRHILLALQSLQPLALSLSADNQDLRALISAAFEKPILRVGNIDDPRLSGVAKPSERFRIEALQQEINDLRALIESELGPSLGVLAGFNSLDGD